MKRPTDKKPPREILSLLLTFLKIGLFTFGGGYAMIPLIERETVEKHKWITGEDLLEIVAVAESTPGPIAINAATFVGSRVGGFFGALAATFGVIAPSFAVIIAVSFVLEQFRSVRWVQYAFNGVRAGVLALIAKALWSMFRKCPKGLFYYALMLAAFAAAAFLPVNAVYIILLCAAFGLVKAVAAKRRDAE